MRISHLFMLALGTAWCATCIAVLADDPPAPPRTSPGVVYILGRDLDEFLSGGGDKIVLQGDAARRYREQAGLDERNGARAPTPLECRIRGELDGEFARLALELLVRAGDDRPGPLRLGLREDSLQLLSATADDKPIALTRGDDGLLAWLEGAGEHRVRLELLARLAGSSDLPALQCTLPEVLVTTLELTASREIAQARFEPSAVVTLTAVPGSKRQRIEAALGPRPKLDLRWQWAGAPPRESFPLVRAYSETSATIEPGVCQIATQLRLQILRGSLDACELRLPADQRLLDLRLADGSDVPWDTRADGSERIITVRFPAPVTNGAELAITSEQPWSGDALTLRGPVVPAALSHRSSVALRSGSDLDVVAASIANARAIDPGQLPASLRSARSDQAFTAVAQPYSLGLSVLPRRPTVSVRTLAVIALGEREATVFLRWQFGVHGGKLAQLAVVLPPPFQASQLLLSDAVVSVRPEKSGDRNMARVFLKGVPDEFELRLRAIIPLATAGDLVRVDLPHPDGARGEAGRLYLVTDKAVSVEATPDLEPSDEPLDAALAADLAVGSRTVRGFQASGVLDRVAFRLARAVPSIRFSTMARLIVESDQVAVVQDFDYAIRGARVQRLRLAVPEPLRGSLRFVTPAEEQWETLPDGELRVRAAGDTAGPARVRLEYRLPRAAVEPASPDEVVTLPLVQSLDGTCDRTELTVSADRRTQVRVEGDGWRRVSGVPVAAAPLFSETLRRAGAAEAVTLRVVTEALDAFAATVVERTLIETQVDANGEWRTRARFVILSLGAPSVRVQAPPGATVGRVRLGDVAVDCYVDRAGGDLVVPLDGSVTRPPAVLEIACSGSAGGWSANGSHTLGAPVLRDVPLGEVFWHVTLPDRTALVGMPDRYGDRNTWRWSGKGFWRQARHDPAELERWLTGQSSRAALAAAPGGPAYLFSRLVSAEPLSFRTLSLPLLVLAASALLFLVGLVLLALPTRGKSWQLGLVLLAGLALYVWQPSLTIECAQAGVLGAAAALFAGLSQHWLGRRAPRHRSVFPEPRTLAGAAGSSVRKDAAAGRSGTASPLGLAMPSTSSARPAGGSSGNE